MQLAPHGADHSQAKAPSLGQMKPQGRQEAANFKRKKNETENKPQNVKRSQTEEAFLGSHSLETKT